MGCVLNDPFSVSLVLMIMVVLKHDQGQLCPFHYLQTACSLLSNLMWSKGECSTNNAALKLAIKDWAFCSLSSQFTNGFCSRRYSNDGRLKCTPNGGFQAGHCVTGPSLGCLMKNVFFSNISGINSQYPNSFR